MLSDISIIISIVLVIALALMDGMCYSDCPGSDGARDHFVVDLFEEKSVYRHCFAQRGKQVQNPATLLITVPLHHIYRYRLHPQTSV